MSRKKSNPNLGGKNTKLECSYCKKIYFKDWPRLDRKKFCSKECYGKFLEINMTGENNPNFGNKWDQKAKDRMADITREKMKSPERRILSAANKGRKFSEETKLNMSKAQKKLQSSQPPRVLSEETKIKIGIASKAKFTPEFNEKVRKTNEEKGNWIPKNQIPDRDIYYKLSNWIGKIFDFIDNDELLKLNTIKLWHYKNNKRGLVRDHAYSRSSGFKEKVFPEILRHPANLRLIFHNENVSKSQKKRGKIQDSISLEQLFLDINDEKWKNWPEQVKILELIELYKNGKRWNK